MSLQHLLGNDITSLQEARKEIRFRRKLDKELKEIESCGPLAGIACGLFLGISIFAGYNGLRIEASKNGKASAVKEAVTRIRAYESCALPTPFKQLYQGLTGGEAIGAQLYLKDNR